MSGRVLFHVQHLVGIGHVRRAATITRALIAAGLEVHVALGGPPVEGTDFGAAAVAQLPPAHADAGDFSRLLDEAGRPVGDAWRAARRDRLLALYDEVRPDVVLIELFPFGRRAFGFELLPLVDRVLWEPGNGVRVVCSVRDILVRKANPKRKREIVEILRRYFDRVLIHGDPQVIALEASFPESAEIEELTRYTGYVADAAPNARRDGKDQAGLGEVVVSTGGGAVGERLLRAALGARSRSALAGRRWRLLAGASLDETVFRALSEQAPPGVVVERARPDFPSLLAGAALSISQGGYNTLVDVIVAGCPALVVPFAEGRESEQTLRARVFAEREWVDWLDPGVLSPESLARAADRAAARPRTARRGGPGPVGIDLGGAAATAQRIVEMVRPGPQPVARDRAIRPPALRRVAGSAGASWDELERELDHWTGCGRTATFWWRDDDACAATPALEHLLTLSGQADVPVGLAVIPALATPDLARAVGGDPRVTVLQHGYRHRNHAPAGVKSCEFGPHRSVDGMLAEVEEGWRRLSGFGNRIPVFVPPWNRVDEALLPYLVPGRYRAISGYGHREPSPPEPLRIVNTHVDVIAWRTTRGFAGTPQVLASLVGHLRARRLGAVDSAEPMGLLTHHQVHDEATWIFLEALFEWTARRPSVEWRDPRVVFDPGCSDLRSAGTVG